MPHCLICENEYQPHVDFGDMPIANAFASKEEVLNEYTFPMKVGFCNHCNMFQLVEQPQPQQMFNENYAFFSGTSRLMAQHFDEFADHVIQDYLQGVDDPFVVEIGSNDGIMLRHFAEKGIRHLGIEPSGNVANVARKRGIKTIVEFFDKELAERIVREQGQADAYLAANVMCHIPYIKSILEGIKALLKPSGIVMFEDPYLGDVIRNTTYDQIYDEHTFLFSVHSVQYLFNQFDMEVIDIEPQETHGGSMRYLIAHSGVRPVQDAVMEQLKLERKLGLTEPATFIAFRESCESYRSDLYEPIK